MPDNPDGDPTSAGPGRGDAVPADGTRGLLRRPGSAEVTPVELFFDLVYVLAVTQLTHHLLEHLTLRGAGETLLLMLAVWLVWINTTWATNYLARNRRPVQLLFLGLTLASLIMSAALPQAFEGRGLAFAAALVTIELGAIVFELLASGGRNPLVAVAQRVLFWLSVLAVLWLAGGLVHGDARAAIWLIAILASYVVMWLGFPVPRLGRAHTTDYTIAGQHMAHRSYLFIIIALGESILITGSRMGESPGSVVSVAAFVTAFVGTAALWWIYFDRAEEAGLRAISTASDPGRLGLVAYTYCHIPMVAGIIVTAAADEFTIAHPTEPATITTTALILGGPALYLLGHALLKWSLLGHVSHTRLAGIAALIALAPLAVVASALVLMTAATLVLVGVVLWDLHAERSAPSLA